MQLHHNVKQRIQLAKRQSEIMHRIPSISHHANQNVADINLQFIRLSMNLHNRQEPEELVRRHRIAENLPKTVSG
jgi:hypothetical protein